MLLALCLPALVLKSKHEIFIVIKTIHHHFLSRIRDLKHGVVCAASEVAGVAAAVPLRRLLFVPGYIPLKYVLRTWQGTVAQLERGRPVRVIGSMFHAVAGDRQRVAGHGAIVAVIHPRKDAGAGGLHEHVFDAIP